MKNLRTLSVKETMARTGFSRDVVYRLVQRGAVRFVRTGGPKSVIRILEESLEEWFAANEQGGTPERRASAPAPPVFLDADDELDRALPLAKHERVFS